jgi:hypothetical protein
VTTEFSETGHRYQLMVRGECGPLTEWLFGDAAIETGHGCTGLIFSARDDSGLYGLLGRIQDLGLHLISLYEVGGTEPVPRLPLRVGLAPPGASPYTAAGPHNPPVGSRGLATRSPGRRARNAKTSGRVAQPLSGRLWPTSCGGS